MGQVFNAWPIFDDRIFVGTGFYEAGFAGGCIAAERRGDNGTSVPCSDSVDLN